MKWPDLKFPPINQNNLMDALAFEEMQEPSPCIGVCKIKDAVCEGCGRTLQEITDWPSMTKQQKREVRERNAS